MRMALSPMTDVGEGVGFVELVDLSWGVSRAGAEAAEDSAIASWGRCCAPLPSPTCFCFKGAEAAPLRTRAAEAADSWTPPTTVTGFIFHTDEGDGAGARAAADEAPALGAEERLRCSPRPLAPTSEEEEEEDGPPPSAAADRAPADCAAAGRERGDTKGAPGAAEEAPNMDGDEDDGVRDRDGEAARDWGAEASPPPTPACLSARFKERSTRVGRADVAEEAPLADGPSPPASAELEPDGIGGVPESAAPSEAAAGAEVGVDVRLPPPPAAAAANEAIGRKPALAASDGDDVEDEAGGAGAAAATLAAAAAVEGADAARGFDDSAAAALVDAPALAAALRPPAAAPAVD
jgi:hypothetical protein